MSSPGPEQSPQDHSTESSAPPSRSGLKASKEKHRVQWNRGGDVLDSQNKRGKFELPSDSSSEENTRAKNPDSLQGQGGKGKKTVKAGFQVGDSSDEDDEEELPKQTRLTRIKTPMRKKEPATGQAAEEEEDEEAENKDHIGEGSNHSLEGTNDPDLIRVLASKAFSQQSAQQRAERLSKNIGTRSAPGSRSATPERERKRVRKVSRVAKGPVESPPPSPPAGGQPPPLDLSDIPLEKLESKRQYGIEDESEDESGESGGKGQPHKTTKRRFQSAARRLIQHHTQRDPRNWFKVRDDPLLRSGQTTPIAERDPYDYIPRPNQYRAGVLGSLLKLYKNAPQGADAINRSVYRGRGSSTSLLSSPGSATNTPKNVEQVASPVSSGTPSPGGTTPKTKPPKWYNNPRPHSTGSIADLVSSSTSLAQPSTSKPGTNIRPSRPKPKHRPLSAQALDTVFGRHKGAAAEEAIRIEIHLADTMQRKAFLLSICRALMAYGAPTHRLEEYMRMSARVLEIDSQFLYMPGCMIVSFGDVAWQTTDVRIVRVSQAVNLSKLHDTHAIYKEVIHDMIGVEEAIDRLERITKRPNRFGPWVLVFVYGLASVCVGPFAFGARPIDLPIAFLLGCLLGFMQLILAPRSELYSNVFEISAAILTSLIARGFGSINRGQTFCFSALAQSAIALILPGYTVLCGSLELQSRNIVAGSVRMVYAIIYSLFLGFGITVGTAIYGAMDKHATSATTCTTTWPFWWQIIFVLPFTFCLIIINHGKWAKMPPMLFLAITGYVVNHYSQQQFASNAQIAQTLGALAIGVCANLYSRIWHGLAAAILLPAIFVQVPSGLAASGSLISGVISADQLTNRTGNAGAGGVTTVSNGSEAAGGLGSGASGMGGVEVNSAVLNVGYSMIQIAIGITVGLFMSALVVYPFGKRRSGLFSF